MKISTGIAFAFILGILVTVNLQAAVYTVGLNGSYSSTMSRSAIMAGGLTSVATDASKIYALPTEDEWYKAAYYSVAGDSYSLYANGTGTAPTRGNGTTGWSYGGYSVPRDIADGSSEQNSTVNMNGNVWEWMEDSAGVIRGGSCYTGEYNLRSSTRRGSNPSVEAISVGFRPVEVVPEPATMGLLGIGAAIVFLSRLKRRFYSL